MSDGQFDSLAFKQAKEYCLELRNNRARLNDMYRRQDDLYWMRWSEENKVKRDIQNVKLTKTPRARNAFIGAKRLLTAADPQFSVPHDINNSDVASVASDLERFSKAMWLASGRVQGHPVHYDVVHSALLYSEVHIAITSTKDLLKAAQGSSRAREVRAQYVADCTPYLFEVWNPQAGCPDYGALGLEAYYRTVKQKAQQVIDNYGEEARAALLQSKLVTKQGEIDANAEVTLNALYTLKDALIWVDGSDRPIKQEEHGLPFIPIVAQGVEGTRLFDKPEEQHEPFLYTLNESGLIERQNLILTLLYSMAFGFSNPMWVNYLHDPDNPPEPDFSVPGGQINMRVGERREVALKQVIDPALVQAWQTATDLEMESTIYRQTLGEPLGANAPYSMVALLAQGGRLPLTVPQRKSSWAIGEAVWIALRWLRENGEKSYARYDDIEAILEPRDIPEHFQIQANLEITLPQDRLNAANTAAVLAQGDDPLLSHSWVLENVLNVGQPEDMQEQIWGEQSAKLMFRRWMMQQLAQISQLEQMAMQPGAAGGMPGGAPMPNPAPPGMTSPEQAPPIPAMEPEPPIQPMPPMQAPPQGGEEMI